MITKTPTPKTAPTPASQVRQPQEPAVGKALDARQLKQVGGGNSIPVRGW
jgi:hypothetical protein